MNSNVRVQRIYVRHVRYSRAWMPVRKGETSRKKPYYR